MAVSHRRRGRHPERRRKRHENHAQAEFIALLQRPELWVFETTGDGEIYKNDIDDQQLVGDEVVTTTTTRCGMWGCVEARHDGVEITYQEYASWEECHPEDYETTTDHGADVLMIYGITVIDEDGDQLDESAIEALIEQHADRAFTAVDWGALLPTKQFENADEDADMTKKSITLTRDNALDLRFNGEMIASVSSSANNASGSYSGSTVRWTTELALYTTAGGRYVCQSIGRTLWEGEHTSRSAAVCDTAEEVIKFFGTGWLAKSLYAAAGIDAAETVD